MTFDIDKMKYKLIPAILLVSILWSLTYGINKQESIVSGVSWFDQNNKEVNAHGICVIKEGDLYYLFGEYKSDTSNAFPGFGCYSSLDLVNWKFERIVLPLQKDGLLGPDRVGERPKVMKCPATGEFVMFMHCDDMGYKDPHVGYASSTTIDGDYEFHGDLLFDGKYIKRWDLGTFQDSDGSGYLLTHEGFIYKLSSDYKSVERIVVQDIAPGGESPAMFKANGLYYWMFSNKTSWERNDNYYFTAPSIEGPWTKKGLFCPEGTLTWNSQCSFVLPLTNGKDTLNIYMGDRWSYPKQGSAATQVWQPVTVNGTEISIPAFNESWQIDMNKCGWSALDLRLTPVNYKQKSGVWTEKNNTVLSNEKGAVLSYPFNGKQIAIHGLSNNTSGYAKIIIRNSKNEEVINTIADFYSLYEYSSLKFLSPVMGIDNYTLTIEVMGEHGVWYKKDGTGFGSTDNYITVEKVLYK